MIRVDFWLVPWGCEQAETKIGEIVIGNTGDGTHELGNYKVLVKKQTFGGRPDRIDTKWKDVVEKEVRLLGFARLKRSIYELAYEALKKALGKEDPPPKPRKKGLVIGETECPLCHADLTGVPIPKQHRQHYGKATHFQRRIGIYDNERDMTVAWQCPDCQGQWPRKEGNMQGLKTHKKWKTTKSNTIHE